jgi:sorting nexin-29
MEYGVTLYHLFVEFKSAYDTVNRKRLHWALYEMKFPTNIIRIEKLTAEDTKSQVRIQSDLSAAVTSKYGLREGDVLVCLRLYAWRK